ncbi:ribose-phosphate pyrophosphokinase [Rickettsiales endosymbiont of Peranema trichophorum]|uniref:ribose-phosphate diphosphokinase n=1 Tax=Rickettsiales endosymbiont of Peranema trichophorum TaxID=2486577 RepID=UPI001023B339|nr:ribose-phosphate pyrophosphokinase [Rickettsiales endosymbiont of Peranema trichophorum]RZI47637.1 ribose-phosphate pyrophosphokinase [Rickettsiales endosymbiont of Peranema trichophorum]
MIIIGGSSHPTFAQQIAGKLGYDCIIANTKKFADRELKVQVNKDLYGEDVIILQSTTKPANDHLMELLLLADTARRAGCNSITAVIPYFGYGRQDRASYEYGPISASLVARLIETSGIDKVVTIDMHSKQSEGFFKIRVKNLDPTDFFAKEFRHSDNYIVISPDVGGLARARVLGSKLGTDLAIINKTRDPQGKCIMSHVIGNVTGKNCIIIDDIVDTGGTLCEAAKILIQSGAHTVSACITHAVFSENCIDRISQAGFAEFFVTDTVHHQNLPSFINVIQVSELIVKALLKCNK